MKEIHDIHSEKNERSMQGREKGRHEVRKPFMTTRTHDQRTHEITKKSITTIITDRKHNTRQHNQESHGAMRVFAFTHAHDSYRAEHLDHCDHSPTPQTCGHACVLHGTARSWSGQNEPPNRGSRSTVRYCVATPPPHLRARERTRERASQRMRGNVSRKKTVNGRQEKVQCDNKQDTHGCSTEFAIS